MSSVGKLMKQAARLQQQMEKVRAELATKTVEGTSGGGAVRVVVRGDLTVASVHIKPEAVNPSDAAFLEDLVLTAVNQAMTAARELQDRDMGSVTQGFSVPGLF
jgi:nucleoid-associated protein EbfC